jgi:hypothetical protein
MVSKIFTTNVMRLVASFRELFCRVFPGALNRIVSSALLLALFCPSPAFSGAKLDAELQKVEDARAEQLKNKGLTVADPLTEEHLTDVERFAHKFMRRIAKRQDWQTLVKYDERGKNNGVLPPEPLLRYKIKNRYLERKYLATYQRFECKFLYLVDVQSEKRERNRMIKFVKTYVLRITDFPELGILTFRRLAENVVDLDGYQIIDYSKFEPLNVKPITYEPVEGDGL